MTDSNKFFSKKGKLTVKARGYWFSPGGKKGSFGYYPQLKDKDGYPVFADTQIHGNFQNAVTWFNKIQDKKNGTEFDINKVFGQEGGSESSLLKFTDLELTKESKEKFDNESRYQIKTRIKINDVNNTVENHFLANFEICYLEGLELEADVYLGYVVDKKEVKTITSTLNNAKNLLTIGAFRSRGYGRGDFFLKWDKEQKISFIPASCETIEKNKEKVETTGATVKTKYNYFLQALVNVRNKPPVNNSTQLIETDSFITEQQLRGWFANIFFKLFKSWPKPSEMALVKFPVLYSSGNVERTITLPPPVTTLINEEKIIEDVWGKVPDMQDDANNEAFIRSKTKPLGRDSYVTKYHTEQKRIKIDIEKRVRNKLDENYITQKNSLFVQEFIKKGVWFGGEIIISSPHSDSDSDFIEKTIFIFNNIKPDIKGTVFDNHFEYIADIKQTEDENASLNNSPGIVVKNIIWDKSFHTKNNSITITTSKRYNTILNRPRRNRIVIAASSVIKDGIEENDNIVKWQGFGKIIGESINAVAKPFDQNPPVDSNNPHSHDTLNNLSDLLKGKLISRSQAGLLRELLNPHLSDDSIETHLKDRIEKLTKKTDLSLVTILKEIQTSLVLNRDEMNRTIRQFLDLLAIKRWDLKNKGKNENN